MATPVSKERDAELRAILRRKEEEVKELLAPEKEMRGERYWKLGRPTHTSFRKE